MELKCYASGDGALHFAFIEQNGKTAGQRPTLEDAQRFLDTSPLAARHRDENWRAVMIGNQPVLVANIVRINDNTVTIDGQEFTYKIDEESLFWKNDRHLIDHALTMEANNLNVRNYNLRVQFRHFINNEVALTGSSPTPRPMMPTMAEDWM
jgi:hypothetical protein